MRAWLDSLPGIRRTSGILGLRLVSVIALLGFDGGQAVPGWPEVASHASLHGVRISTDSSSMVGRLFSPTFKLGQDCAPAILLLHGIPGVEQNMDLAYALRDAGMHCLAVHYRGCWGSPGKLSIETIQEDVVAAFRWMVARRDVDLEHVMVIGHGLGGYHALKLGIEGGLGLPSVLRGVVAISPLSPDGSNSLPLRTPDSQAPMDLLVSASAAELDAGWSGLKTIKDLVREHRHRNATAKLPILFVSGDSDELCTAKVLEEHALKPLRDCKMFDVKWRRKRLGDHGLCRYRKEMVGEVVSFVVESVGLQHVISGESIGSPWIRSPWVFDVFPLLLILANSAGFLAGRFSVSSGGRELAAAEAAAEAQGFEDEQREDELRHRSSE